MIAAPQNSAFARASCIVAVAINDECTDCTTIADAYQVFLQVDDPNATAGDVADDMRNLDAELRAVSTDPNITLAEARARIAAAVDRFWAVAATIDEQRSASH